MLRNDTAVPAGQESLWYPNAFTGPLWNRRRFQRRRGLAGRIVGKTDIAANDEIRTPFDVIENTQQIFANHAQRHEDEAEQHDVENDERSIPGERALIEGIKYKLKQHEQETQRAKQYSKNRYEFKWNRTEGKNGVKAFLEQVEKINFRSAPVASGAMERYAGLTKADP